MINIYYMFNWHPSLLGRLPVFISPYILCPFVCPFTPVRSFATFLRAFKSLLTLRIPS